MSGSRLRMDVMAGSTRWRLSGSLTWTIFNCLIFSAFLMVVDSGPCGDKQGAGMEEAGRPKKLALNAKIVSVHKIITLPLLNQ